MKGRRVKHVLPEQLQQVLEEALLVYADLVKLIQVNQEETAQITFRITLAAEVQT